MKHIAILPAFAFLLLSSPTFAKLPEVTPEAKAKAAEAAAKTAWTNKVADFQLCKSQDKVAAAYQAQAKAEKKAVTAPAATPACADPGPFAYAPPPEAKPIEAAGAHSPPQTASTPPSTTAPAAAQPNKK